MPLQAIRQNDLHSCAATYTITLLTLLVIQLLLNMDFKMEFMNLPVSLNGCECAHIDTVLETDLHDRSAGTSLPEKHGKGIKYG